MKRQLASAAVFLAVVLALAIGAQSALVISPTSLPVGGGVFFVGQQIPVQQLTTDRSSFDFITWSVSAGSLPPGLALNGRTGAISGTTTQAGTFPFTIQAVDSENSNYLPGTQNYTLYVSSGTPLTVTPNTPDAGAVGSSYASFPYTASGGVPGSYVWTFQTGTNSDGLALDASSGLLSGIPQAGGVFPIAVTVTDGAGTQVSPPGFSLNVLGISAPALPDGSIGTPYSQAFTAVGATGPVTWSLGTGGILPPGLNLNAQGQITGTPTVLGIYPFQVRVTDSAAKLTAAQTFSISITSVTSPLTVSTTSPLPNGTVGAAYSFGLQATGGTGAYSWSATGLPAGLQLDPTSGILSGTPTAGGTSTISVTVTDAANRKATASLALTVDAFTIIPATLPNGNVSVAYPPTTLTVTNATVSSWAVTVGALPAGLALNTSTGVISGTPTAVGSSTFTITATLANRASSAAVVQAFTLVINAAPTVTISGLPTTGVAATQPLAGITLSDKSPVTTTGTLTLTFVPTAGGTQPFDAKFASGLPYTASFTIAAGNKQGLFGAASSVPVMIGTVAGKITIHTTLQDPSLKAPDDVVITVNPTVPVITKVTFGAVTNGTFTISVTGRSTPRDMTSALFHFALPTTTSPSTLDVTVPVTTQFASWYSSSASSALGSTFTATFQFSFTGPPGSTTPFTAVTVTMTNSAGASNAFGPTSP